MASSVTLLGRSEVPARDQSTVAVAANTANIATNTTNIATNAANITTNSETTFTVTQTPALDNSANNDGAKTITFYKRGNVVTAKIHEAISVATDGDVSLDWPTALAASLRPSTIAVTALIPGYYSSGTKPLHVTITTSGNLKIVEQSGATMVSLETLVTPIGATFTYTLT